jgi:hypothetical protein
LEFVWDLGFGIWIFPKMADRAHVTSVEAIEMFRANLIAYVGKARPVLEDACDEVMRTRQWLQHDRRMHWENQLKRRRKILEEAEQALFGSRISNLREPSSAEMAAVTRAKRAFDEAEEKLRLVKRWTMEFDNRVQPLVKELEGLRTMLANDMPKAAAHLAQVVKTLDAYANVKATSVATMPASEETAVDAANETSAPEQEQKTS